MNRISEAFKNGPAFIGFLTAGDPDINTTKELIKTICPKRDILFYFFLYGPSYRTIIIFIKIKLK